MRLSAQSAKRTLAIVTLALASCRGSIKAVSPTPELVAMRFMTTNSTAPLLRTLASNYQTENTLISISDQPEVSDSQSADSDTDLPPPYKLTTFFDPDVDQWAAPIGQDAVAIIAHPDVPLEKLTAGNLRDIFTGNQQNWRFINGQDQSITIVSHAPKDDTYRTFRRITLGRRQISPGARLALGNKNMLDIVASTPGAIGYISYAQVDSSVQVVPVAEDELSEAIRPSLATIYEEVYPLRMPILIVGPRPPTPGDGYYEFIQWIQTDGQAFISQDYAPLPPS